MNLLICLSFNTNNGCHKDIWIKPRNLLEADKQQPL